MMRRSLLGFALATLSSAAFGINFGNVMFAGDSITSGWEPTGRGGYRGPLLDAVRGGGNLLTPVGQMTSDGWNLPLADRQHEGHNGWRTEQISAGLVSWLPTHQPDTLLIMSGTNNTNDYTDPVLTRTRVSNLLDVVFAYRTSVRVFIANIPDANPNTSWEWAHRIHADNVDAAVRAEVIEHQGLGRAITFVDVRSSINPATDLADAVHPTTVGYQKIAGAWATQMNAVPEPSSLALAGTAVAAIIRLRRRRGS